MDLVVIMPRPKASGASSRIPRLRSRSSRRRVGLFGLLAAIGFLAFMFSAVSPYDDDVQQEFVQSNKSKQFTVSNYKSAPDPQTFGAHRVPPVILHQRRLNICLAALQHDFVAHDGALRTFSSNAIGDRSPPTKLS